MPSDWTITTAPTPLNNFTRASATKANSPPSPKFAGTGVGGSHSHPYVATLVDVQHVNVVSGCGDKPDGGTVSNTIVVDD